MRSSTHWLSVITRARVILSTALPIFKPQDFMAYRKRERKNREEANIPLRLLDRLECVSLGAVDEENAQVYEDKEACIWASFTRGVWLVGLM